MKISVNWLNEYVKVDDLDVNVLADTITNAGIEIEGVESLSSGTGLTTGLITCCEDHPDSDHLHVCKVDIGSEVLDIVCGAPNAREGIKVIVAKVGAQLPGGNIKASTIRGVASNGMLCSLLELGIDKAMLPEGSASLNGIEELDESIALGNENILKYLGYQDYLLDVSPTPNRADCSSMWGFALEVGAILNREVNIPWIKDYANQGKTSKLVVESKASGCPIFLGKVINSLKLGPSPKWMQQHLLASGVKSINNVVDISNYVMLETGQPLHFYDLRSNPDQHICVVDDYSGEYTALDGMTYAIQENDLMITSKGSAAGIAGIMGGDNTKIENDTTGIIIEAALFKHDSIRKTSNRIGLQTEAALRFSKGLDPLAQVKAMDRAVELLVKYADASDLEETKIYGEVTYQPRKVEETLSHMNMLLGTHYSMDEVVDVLSRLNLKPDVTGDVITCTVPSYRSLDISLPCDIDEEVIRIKGFDSLPTTLPYMPMTNGKLTPAQSLRRVIRSLLCSNGLNETVSFTLVDDYAANHGALPLGECIAIASPLSEDRKYVRSSLLGSLASVASYNLAHNNKDINLFEVSSVYANKHVDLAPGQVHHYKDDNPWYQQEHLGIFLNGNLQQSRVLHQETMASFYTLKGLLFALLDKIGYDSKRVQLKPNTLNTTDFHPYQSATLSINNKVVAIFGRLHPNFEAHYDIKEGYFAEVNLDALLTSNPSAIKIAPINKYPTISRDISLVVEDSVQAKDLIALIKKNGANMIKQVEVFDIYKGEHVEKGYKSISLKLVYESYEQTLKDNDINPVHEKVLEALNAKYNATLRS